MRHCSARPEGKASVGAVVLAAGESRRFGRQKLLMPFGDSSIIGRVIATLDRAGIHPIVVVAGADAADIAGALSGSKARIVVNPAPERGMLSSVQTGLRALDEAVERFLVVLGDQPRVTSADVIHLLEEQERLGRGIAIAAHQGKRGHPVAFHRRYRESILECDDRKTLRDTVHAHLEDTVNVESPADAVTRDIDTREQYDDELRRYHDEQ
jgi:molybdenum cofactor cytidylyltransferase